MITGAKLVERRDKVFNALQNENISKNDIRKFIWILTTLKPSTSFENIVGNILAHTDYKIGIRNMRKIYNNIVGLKKVMTQFNQTIGF